MMMLVYLLGLSVDKKTKTIFQDVTVNIFIAIFSKRKI